MSKLNNILTGVIKNTALVHIWKMKAPTDVILQLKSVDVTGSEWMAQLEEFRLKLVTRKWDVSKYDLLEQREMNKYVLRLHTLQYFHKISRHNLPINFHTVAPKETPLQGLQTRTGSVKTAK